MRLDWTKIQHKRLVELGADKQMLTRGFETPEERRAAFQELAKTLGRRSRKQLDRLRSGHRRPKLCQLESRLAETLAAEGFVQVSTPIIMSRGLLEKMSITSDHELNDQVYWVDRDKCLRPMLAPHLYYVVKDLLRLWEAPVSIFEIGPCFRKETDGAQHAPEFTMLNLCEFGLPEDTRRERLEILANLVLDTAGVSDAHFESETSAVYGTTIDMISGTDSLELGSGAMGPHPLDRAWKITDTWVGIGFGLERLLMASEGSENLSRFGRSISYLDGIRLNI